VKQHYKIGLAMAAILLGGIAGMLPALKAADEAESIPKLLARAKAQAYAISVDAAVLQSYTRSSSLDWRTHAKQISRMKAHINAAAKTVAALDAAKGHAAPWQVTAINRILPYMREIAEDTTNAIEYLNENQSRLTNQEYKEYLTMNSDMSRELAVLVAQFVDYGNSKRGYDKLQKSLELPAK
jgi:hypothetical protein